MDVCVSFDWRRLGTVTLVSGKLSFPATPAVPGVWRVAVGDEVHHGAAQNLRTAAYMLAAPGPTQTTNQRVHNAIVNGLDVGRAAVLDVITAARGGPGSRLASLDLAVDEVRALVKAAAVNTQDQDPDPDSAAYRRAHAAVREAVVELARCDLMLPLADGRPLQPAPGDIRSLRRAAAALQSFMAEHDLYWPARWGRDGNPTK